MMPRNGWLMQVLVFIGFWTAKNIFRRPAIVVDPVSDVRRQGW